MASIQPRSFGDLLRRYRVAAGLTQEELAERAGLSRRAIGALETGDRRTPHKETISLLASALGLTQAEHAQLESTARQRVPDAGTLTAAMPGSAHGRAGLRQSMHALVGRKKELRAVENLLTGAGSPLLMLTGEAGIGKSRLLNEAMRLASERGWTVLSGGCHRRSGQEPYAPVVAMLTRFLAARTPAQQRLDLQGCSWLVRLLPELATQLVSPALAWVLSPEQERRLLFGAVGRLLANVAGSAGTLVVLDDLQWAGDETLDLLAALLRENETRKLRFIGAFRDTDVTARDSLPLLLSDFVREDLATRLALSALGHDEARELLAELLLSHTGEAEGQTSRQADQSVLVDVALERSGGLPFFLVSWAQEIRAGMLSADAARTAVPWSAAESIHQRVAALSDTAQDVLTVAAVAGHQVSRGVLLAATRSASQDEQGILSGLDAAIRARLIAETADGSYIFTHDLIRETIAGDLGGARQASLHRRVAQAIEEQPLAERRVAELAWHLVEGDEPARALPYMLQAADQAKASYAHGDAEQHFRMAARLARQLGDQAAEADALERLSAVLYNVGRIADLPATLESAAALRKEIGDLDQYAWDTAYIARADISLGRAAAGVGRLQTLLTALDTLSNQGADSQTAGRAIQPIQHASSPMDLEIQAARAATMLSPRSTGRIYLSLTACLVHSERYEEAVPLGEHAVSYANAAGEAWSQARAHRFLGRALEATGQIARASEAFETGGAIAERVLDLEGIIHNYGDLGGIYLRRGAFDQALSSLKFVMETAERFGVPEWILHAASSLAQTSYLMGDWGQVRAYCARALEMIPISDVLTDSPWPMYVLGMLRLAQGDMQQASTCLDQAIVMSERAQNLPMLRAARAAPAEMELLNRHAHAAHERLVSLFGQPADSEGPVVEVSGMVAHLPLVPLLAWVHADLGDMDKAEALLSDGIVRATALEQYVVLVDALRLRALLAMRRAQWKDARHALDEALSRSRAMPYPYAEAKALFLYGQLHAARHEHEQASAAYQAALAILNRLGERVYAEHLERALAGLTES